VEEVDSFANNVDYHSNHSSEMDNVEYASEDLENASTSSFLHLPPENKGNWMYHTENREGNVRSSGLNREKRGRGL